MLQVPVEECRVTLDINIEISVYIFTKEKPEISGRKERNETSHIELTPSTTLYQLNMMKKRKKTTE